MEKKKEEREGKKQRKARMHRATNPRKSFVATGTGEKRKWLASCGTYINEKKAAAQETHNVFYFQTKIRYEIPSPKIIDR